MEPLVLRGHEGSINSLAIRSDGRTLDTGSQDGTARVWDLTGRGAAATPMQNLGEVGDLDIPYPAAQMPIVLKEFAQEFDPYPDAYDIPMRNRSDADNAIVALAVSADNRWLAAETTNGRVRLWHMSLEDLIELSRVTAGRNLTLAEWDSYFPGQPYRKTVAKLPGLEDPTQPAPTPS